MKFKYYPVILSVIGIIFLYFLAEVTEPPFVELQKIQEHEGKKVTTTGYVKNYYLNTYDNQIIEIENNNYSIKIFNMEPTELEYGDFIQVTGVVQRYKGEWEVLVENKNFIKTIQKWKNISHPIWELAQNPIKYLNQNVNVTGYIDLVYDDYFYLKDLNQKYSLIVFYNDSKSLSAGQEVCVLGRFLFDEKNLCYKIEISSKKHGVFLYYTR